MDRPPHSPRFLRLALAKRKPVVHGVVDSTFASLTTFAAALFAVRSLDVELIGLFSFYYAAYRVAAVVPRQLVFVPAEIESVAVDARDRLAVFRASSRLAIGPVAVATIVVVGGATILAPGGFSQAVVPLAVTAAAASVATPFQEHLRRAFHLAGSSQRAGLVSAVNFAVVLTAIGVALLANVPPVWIPLGSLAVAYGVSTCFGALLIRTERAIRWTGRLTRSGLIKAGRALLLAGLAPVATGFLVALLIARLAGAEALGYAESARIVARPVLVLAIGVAAALRPRAMEAGHRRSRNEARTVSRRYAVIIGGATLVYLGLAGLSGPWNLLQWLIPAAYVVPGLVALTVAAAGVDALALPYRYQLLGAGRGAAYAKVEVVGNVAYTLCGAAAGVLKAFALPVGLFALGLFRLVGYQENLERVFGNRRRARGAGRGSRPPPERSEPLSLVESSFEAPRDSSEA